MKIAIPLRQFASAGILLACLLLLVASPATAQRNPLKVVSPATRQLVVQGKYAEALPELNQRLLLDSLNVDLLGIRAECHLNLPGEAHAVAALTDLNKALRTLPNDGALRADRGHVYFLLHRYAEAIFEMSFALSQTPADAPLIAQRAYCYLSVNQLPEALVDITRATSMAHNQQDYVMLLGVIQMTNGNFNLALKTFDNLVTKHKSLGMGYAVRATIRQQLTDSTGAYKDIAKALQISPADSATKLVAAFIYEKAGKQKDAEKLYNEIQSQAKSKASFYMERGDLHLQVGDITAAEDDWRKAAALHSIDAVTRLAAHYKPHPK